MESIRINENMAITGDCLTKEIYCLESKSEEDCRYIVDEFSYLKDVARSKKFYLRKKPSDETLPDELTDVFLEKSTDESTDSEEEKIIKVVWSEDESVQQKLLKFVESQEMKKSNSKFTLSMVEEDRGFAEMDSCEGENVKGRFLEVKDSLEVLATSTKSVHSSANKYNDWEFSTEEDQEVNRIWRKSESPCTSSLQIEIGKLPSQLDQEFHPKHLDENAKISLEDIAKCIDNINTNNQETDIGFGKKVWFGNKSAKSCTSKESLSQTSTQSQKSGSQKKVSFLTENTEDLFEPSSEKSYKKVSFYELTNEDVTMPAGGAKIKKSVSFHDSVEFEKPEKNRDQHVDENCCTNERLLVLYSTTSSNTSINSSSGKSNQEVLSNYSGEKFTISDVASGLSLTGSNSTFSTHASLADSLDFSEVRELSDTSVYSNRFKEKNLHSFNNFSQQKSFQDSIEADSGIGVIDNSTKSSEAKSDTESENCKRILSDIGISDFEKRNKLEEHELHSNTEIKEFTKQIILQYLNNTLDSQEEKIVNVKIINSEYINDRDTQNSNKGIMEQPNDDKTLIPLVESINSEYPNDAYSNISTKESIQLENVTEVHSQIPAVESIQLENVTEAQSHIPTVELIQLENITDTPSHIPAVESMQLENVSEAHSHIPAVESIQLENVSEEHSHIPTVELIPLENNSEEHSYISAVESIQLENVSEAHSHIPTVELIQLENITDTHSHIPAVESIQLENVSEEHSHIPAVESIQLENVSEEHSHISTVESIQLGNVSEEHSHISTVESIQLENVTEEHSHISAVELIQLEIVSEEHSHIPAVESIQLENVSEEQSHISAVESIQLENITDTHSHIPAVESIQLENVSEEHSHISAVESIQLENMSEEHSYISTVESIQLENITEEHSYISAVESIQLDIATDVHSQIPTMETIRLESPNNECTRIFNMELIYSENCNDANSQSTTKETLSDSTKRVLNFETPCDDNAPECVYNVLENENLIQSLSECNSEESNDFNSTKGNLSESDLDEFLINTSTSFNKSTEVGEEFNRGINDYYYEDYETADSEDEICVNYFTQSDLSISYILSKYINPDLSTPLNFKPPV